MEFQPGRVVSLQPSATAILQRIGLLDAVVACTKWCADVVPAVRESGRLIIHDSWTAQSSEILAARPDLVIASVPYQVEAVAEIMKAGIPFLGLAPRSLEDVYKDIALIAGVMQVPERGREVIRQMQAEIEGVRARTAGLKRARVFCEEWGKPLIRSQQWVAELVDAAGGEFVGEPGKRTSFEEVAAAEPDVIVMAWCGAGDRVPLEKLIAKRGWERLQAPQNGRVYCISDELLNTPAPTLVGGLYALAAVLHPEEFGESAPGLRRIQQPARASAEAVTR